MQAKTLTVEHSWYGCETGCCGHRVTLEYEDESEREQFFFEHADDGEDVQAFAAKLAGLAFKEEAKGLPVTIGEAGVVAWGRETCG